MKQEFNKKTANILVRVTLREKHVFSERAKRHDLSMSAFLRFLVRQTPLPNVEKTETIKNLLKINADLARLGNLFMLAISEGFDFEEITGTSKEIRELVFVLKDKIIQISK